MQKVIFTLSILLLSSNAIAQSKLLKKLDYRVEIGISQNTLNYDISSGSAGNQSQLKFKELFLLPSFQASAIYPVGENVELDINASYLVFGGRDKRDNGMEEQQQIKSLGFGITPSYLLTNQFRLGLIVQDNFILKAKSVVEDQQNTKTFNETDAHKKHVFRTGLRIDYRFRRIVIAGTYSLNITDLLSDPLLNDISKTNHNIGLSIGYRFNK